jgi:signal transduction histidine kinase
MQVQDEQSQDEVIVALQGQVEALTEANRLLREQLARKEQFAAMIAHEMRSPLTPIINYAQMIARPNQRHESVVRGTNIIISQAWRLTRLANDLLDASRLSSGQFSLACNRCDVTALVKEVVDQLRPVAPYHTFVVETPDSPITGNWDSGRLQQALGNLLDNAIKYSDEGTTITVRVWQAQERAHVSVHNQGVGIASSDIALLFRPFGRLQAASTQQGAGLGLYITKSIIEAHGGTLGLESCEGEGQGTTFTFDLPMPPLIYPSV